MGYSSAFGTVAIAKQTAKGTPAAAPTVKFKLAGRPSLRPRKDRGRYEVTDVGQDPGPSFTQGMGATGEFQVYMEPQAMSLLWYLVLGANADSGVNPNYTHTATPAEDVPYCTIWYAAPGGIFLKFVDCKIGRVGVEGTSLNPFLVSVAMEGISAVFEATDTVLAALEPAGYLFPELEARVKFDTVAQSVHRLVFGINRNISPYFADGYKPAQIDPGKRELELAVGLRYNGPTAFPKWREYFFGSDAGTEQSAVVATHAFEVEILRNANVSQKIALPQVTWTPFEVQSDPGGDPVEIELACNVEKPAGAPIATITSKDQVATV